MRTLYCYPRISLRPARFLASAPAPIPIPQPPRGEPRLVAAGVFTFLIVAVAFFALLTISRG